MSDEKEPLKDEAAAREKWRGTDDRSDMKGTHARPASEDEGQEIGPGPGSPRPMPPD